MGVRTCSNAVAFSNERYIGAVTLITLDCDGHHEHRRFSGPETVGVVRTSPKNGVGLFERLAAGSREPVNLGGEAFGSTKREIRKGLFGEGDG